MKEERPYDASVIRDVLNSRRSNKALATRLLLPDWWETSRSPSASYSKDFWKFFALPGGSSDPIKDYVEDLKQKQSTVRVLDIMSYGALVRGLQVDGCSIALRDRRSRTETLQDQSHNRELVAGDMLSPNTWKKVAHYLAKQQNPFAKFDLIVCRPIMGISRIPRNPKVYGWLLNQIYPLLSPFDGRFVTVYPDFMAPYVGQRCTDLSQIQGIRAMHIDRDDTDVFGDGIFFLTKSPTAPPQLPGRPTMNDIPQ